VRPFKKVGDNIIAVIENRDSLSRYGMVRQGSHLFHLGGLIS
jgi:hypothetical protein